MSDEKSLLGPPPSLCASTVGPCSGEGNGIICRLTFDSHLSIFDTCLRGGSACGGPPAWSLLLLLGVLGGIGMALLMGVMRSLLVRATALRQEMASVI